MASSPDPRFPLHALPQHHTALSESIAQLWYSPMLSFSMIVSCSNVIGVEPSDASNFIKQKRIKLIKKFFNYKTSDLYLKKYERPKIITITNVLAQIENINELAKSLKNIIITSLVDGKNKEAISTKINAGHDKIIKEINENSNIQMIIKNKKEEDITDLLDELIQDHKEQSNLRKIESLEQKLINNLDENSYSELIKLKSQLNRE